jgi:hypothetical protein
MSEENVELVRRLYPEEEVDMVRLFGDRDRARGLEAAGLPE